MMIIPVIQQFFFLLQCLCLFRKRNYGNNTFLFHFWFYTNSICYLLHSVKYLIYTCSKQVFVHRYRIIRQADLFKETLVLCRNSVLELEFVLILQQTLGQLKAILPRSLCLELWFNGKNSQLIHALCTADPEQCYRVRYS